MNMKWHWGKQSDHNREQANQTHGIERLLQRSGDMLVPCIHDHPGARVNGSDQRRRIQDVALVMPLEIVQHTSNADETKEGQVHEEVKEYIDV